ncbi:MAG TPA: universal stress protein, partial [Roseiflexaceae bacterium]|nr:universal stress protein [Roseiflexaceae bacterium]
MFQKILAAVDGSPQSSAALRQAVDLAQQCHAKLCVLHAFPHVSDLLGNPQYDHLLAARAMIGEAVLDAARQQVGEAVPVETQLIEGP